MFRWGSFVSISGHVVVEVILKSRGLHSRPCAWYSDLYTSQFLIVYSKSTALTMTTRFPSKGPSSKAELGSADPEALTYRRIYSSTIAYVESLPATHLRALARLRELLARLDLRCSE